MQEGAAHTQQRGVKGQLRRVVSTRCLHEGRHLCKTEVCRSRSPFLSLVVEVFHTRVQGRMVRATSDIPRGCELGSILR